jgi:SsrA-binding protein
VKIINKDASRSFITDDRFEAGIVLIGSEVKAIRLGHADLSGSYVKLLDGQAYLVNAKIFPYKFSRVENYEETRMRKLLLHKKQLLLLKHRLESGNLTLVPLSLYTTGRNLMKLEFAIAKGKKEFDKREDIKKRVENREIEREIKNSLK